MKNLVLGAALGFYFLLNQLHASDQRHWHSAYRHAPLGVMGDHTHNKGELMFSYRSMYMQMEGNQHGGKPISEDEIAMMRSRQGDSAQSAQPAFFRVVPTNMSMHKHMFSWMYAPSNKLTLMLMTSYTQIEMDHVTFRGSSGTERLGEFSAQANGLGDTRVLGLYSLYNSHRYNFHLNLGLSLPTGSTSKRDYIYTPMGSWNNLRLPYPMQLGSGTYDLIAGGTYQAYSRGWNWGAQYLATIRTAENSEGYRLGHQHDLTLWGAYSLSLRLSASVRMSYLNTSNIRGRDDAIRGPVQTSGPERQAKRRWNIHAGLNWLTEGGHRYALEIGVPVEQELDGPQLETDRVLTIGYQLNY